MVEAVRPRGAGRAVEVPRIRGLSREAFHTDFVARGRPVVLDGVASGWTATRRWSFEFFRANYGEDPVLLVDHPYYRASGDGRVVETTLGALIDGIVAGGAEPIARYARFHPLLDRHPELKADLDLAWLEAAMHRPTLGGFPFTAMFFGDGGTSTPTHCAGNDNLFLQVVGTKRWHLWPPAYRHVLDVEANHGPAKHSAYLPGAPDPERFPAMAHLDTWEAEIGPGDLLYVPPYTWHHVHNPEPSIGAALRWTSLAGTWRQDPLLTAFEFLNLRPPIWRTMWPRGPFDFNRVLAERLARGRG